MQLTQEQQVGITRHELTRLRQIVGILRRHIAEAKKPRSKVSIRIRKADEAKLLEVLEEIQKIEREKM